MELFSAFLLLFAFSTVHAVVREAKDDEFPFHVSIQSFDRKHLCGGAIITPKWVLATKPCLEHQRSVTVAYGSADANNPQKIITSQRIILQNEFSLSKKNSLALIELANPIEFSKTVKQAGLPTGSAELRNTTKLSGWKVTREQTYMYNLFVNDVYYVIPKDCKTETGLPVPLAVDEFCGMDENHTNGLFNPGSIVSKSAIVLGILANEPHVGFWPSVYVKLSEHEQWIRDNLKTDAQHVNWVENVPKDSAPANAFISISLIGISAIFLRFI